MLESYGADIMKVSYADKDPVLTMGRNPLVYRSLFSAYAEETKDLK